MNEAPIDIQVGSIHATNKYGDLEVIKYNGSLSVLVRFVDTGYQTTVQSIDIRRGVVKDRLKPSILGVGFVGDGKYKTKENYKRAKSYQAWINMLRRCYCAKHQEKNPSYIGCSVSPEWFNYQNFAKWYEENHPSDGKEYEIDKDIKVDGNKVYGPDMCKFVSHSRNSEKAHAKHYSFISPDGEVVDIYNLRKFCRNNELSQSAMSNVHNEKERQYKGWKKNQSQLHPRCRALMLPKEPSEETKFDRIYNQALEDVRKEKGR